MASAFEALETTLWLWYIKRDMEALRQVSTPEFFESKVEPFFKDYPQPEVSVLSHRMVLISSNVADIEFSSGILYLMIMLIIR